MDIEKILKDHKKWLRGHKQGKRIDLYGIDMENVDLENADLTEAILHGSNLYLSNLKGARLEGARLNNTNLSFCDLISADLIGANLKDADLTGANLKDANLTSAKLISAKLLSADLIGANLKDANLTSAKLISADLIGANLKDADLTGANLTGADLTGANLTGANLTGANLKDADLIDADLTGANLKDADLTGADLTGANLKDADLIGADLTGANLKYADLIGADTSKTNKTNNKMKKSDYIKAINIHLKNSEDVAFATSFETPTVKTLTVIAAGDEPKHFWRNGVPVTSFVITDTSDHKALGCTIYLHDNRFFALIHYQLFQINKERHIVEIVTALHNSSIPEARKTTGLIPVENHTENVGFKFGGKCTIDGVQTGFNVYTYRVKETGRSTEDGKLEILIDTPIQAYKAIFND